MFKALHLRYNWHGNPLLPPTHHHINFTSLFLSFPEPFPSPPYSPFLPPTETVTAVFWLNLPQKYPPKSLSLPPILTALVKIHTAVSRSRARWETLRGSPAPHWDGLHWGGLEGQRPSDQQQIHLWEAVIVTHTSSHQRLQDKDKVVKNGCQI